MDYRCFNNFLAGINLEELGEKYRPIKIVELDMPKHVQALACLYKQYWDKKADWLGYESFYAIYKNSIADELEQWRKKEQFSSETFYRGLPARIYRTWASLLTQIQGAYVAEHVYGKGNVRMGVSEDHRGKDLVINLGDDVGFLPVQIKKLSYRKEAQRPNSAKNKYIQIDYAVAPPPKTSTGRDSKPFQRWLEEWGDKLERLENGFVVFKPKMFELRNLLDGIVE